MNICNMCGGRGKVRNDSFSRHDPEFSWDTCPTCYGTGKNPEQTKARVLETYESMIRADQTWQIVEMLRRIPKQFPEDEMWEQAANFIEREFADSMYEQYKEKRREGY